MGGDGEDRALRLDGLLTAHAARDRRERVARLGAGRSERALERELAVAIARAGAGEESILAPIEDQSGLPLRAILPWIRRHRRWARVLRRRGADDAVDALLAEDGDPPPVREAVLRAAVQAVAGGSAALDAMVAAADRDELGRALAAVIDHELVTWIQADRARRERAEAALARIAPPDPGAELDREAREAAGRRRRGPQPYDLIIVPGFTPRDADPAPGVHPVAMRRLEVAEEDLRLGKAAFVLLSGANVHPPGTPFYEAIEMREALIGMGVAPDRIVLDCRARHSTTNLRNAGRFMLAHGMKTALITTTMGQDFYFSAPGLSTFHGRCMRELGYRVGTLRDVPGDMNHAVYEPAREVTRFHLGDPLDP